MHVLTLPNFHYKEVNIVKEMLQWSQVIVHIRKPLLSQNELKDYLSKFTDRQREQIILHGHPDVAREYGIYKIHYSTIMRKRNTPQALRNASVVSTSTHSWTEFNGLGLPIQTAFIGPIFPSISKPGYRQVACITSESRSNFQVKAIALGGLCSANVSELSNANYDNFAFCGAIWQADSPITEAKRCYELTQNIQNNYSASRI